MEPRRLAALRAVVRDGGRDGLSAPSKVLEIWTEELRYAWAHAPGGLLTITMHPECIGRGSRMAMLERFIDAAAGAGRRRLRPAGPLRRGVGRRRRAPPPA